MKFVKRYIMDYDVHLDYICNVITSQIRLISCTNLYNVPHVLLKRTLMFYWLPSNDSTLYASYLNISTSLTAAGRTLTGNVTYI